MPLRIAFMGSPAFALPTMEAVLEAGHEIACVYSQPARPAGRGQSARRTAVHEAAAVRGIEVRTPVNLKGAEDREAFAALKLDAAVVVAYGLLLPPAILAAPRLGCYNLHGSLLPRWRGAAPIQRAVMAGDAETGVQVMRIEAGLDTGPVMLTERTPIGADDTAQDVHDRLSVLGAALMTVALARLEAGTARLTPQAETGATHAAKITSAEAQIDWSRPARQVSAHIRGLSPHPGAWFEMDRVPWQTEVDRVRLKVLNASVEAGAGPAGVTLDGALLVACGEGAVRLTRLQRAGKGPMNAEDFLRGAPIEAGRRLT
ncbi:MAG: methionyl-tRNA formyltransferase [Alphaproteobacteria bacterium]|nr:methionyl-tRNA formyltransferase [Alphaproteobacteria bacterium]